VAAGVAAGLPSQNVPALREMPRASHAHEVLRERLGYTQMLRSSAGARSREASLEDRGRSVSPSMQQARNTGVFSTTTATELGSSQASWGTRLPASLASPTLHAPKRSLLSHTPPEGVAAMTKHLELGMSAVPRPVRTTLHDFLAQDPSSDDLQLRL